MCLYPLPEDEFLKVLLIFEFLDLLQYLGYNGSSIGVLALEEILVLRS